MKHAAALVLVALTAACGSSPQQSSAPAESAPAPAPPPAPAPAAAGTGAAWSVTEGIATPESVYVDPQSGAIFSSQIVGMPTDRDGNGRIVKLNPDGSVASANWVTGLNAPKGLRSHQGTLWTADLDEVVGIDIASGRITSRVKIAGAQFLNDVATGPDGTVYVSDMMANRIYAVKDGKVATFAEGEEMEWPNGLLVDGNRLIVGGWGKPEADFSTKVPGRLFALDLATRAKTLITPMPFGNTDGLESDGRGGYIVSNYLSGAILHVAADGSSRPLRQFGAGAADIGLVAGTGTLLVPHMNDNMVAAYSIADALK